MYSAYKLNKQGDWRRQWHPTPVLLPGKFHGQRSLVGCSPWARKEPGRPLTCLLRNLYAGQEAIVRIGHETTDWFQIRKGVPPGFILSLCLLNLYAEYIVRNTGLDEAQGGIMIAGRNINNLRYEDDTTLMAESEEDLNPVDESERGE